MNPSWDLCNRAALDFKTRQHKIKATSVQEIRFISELAKETPRRRQEMLTDSFLGGRALSIDSQLFMDARGTLCPLEFPINGFMPVRAFLVSTQAGAVRGGHGHYKARQLLMRVSGEIKVELRLGGQIAWTILDAEHRLLLIEPGVWARQIYHGEHPALMVFSDRAYEKEDYFQDNRTPIPLPRKQG